MSNLNIASHESSGSDQRLAARIEHAERPIEQEQAVGFGKRIVVVTRQCADCA